MAGVCDHLSRAVDELHASDGDREVAGDLLRRAASEAEEIQDDDLARSTVQVVDRYALIVREGITGQLPEPERRDLVSAMQAVELACSEEGATVDLFRPFVAD